MADCKVCGAWFSSTAKTEICPTCERALKRLNGYAVPVVHGQWIPLEYDGYADGNPVWDLWECSECREEHSGDEDTLTPYCPNCGAKMDGGNGERKKVNLEDVVDLEVQTKANNEAMRKVIDFMAGERREGDG